MQQSGQAGVISLICLTCGSEQHYDHEVPPSVTCIKCGGVVFRQFATPTDPDDATVASLEQQARSIALDDDVPDTTPDDVRDLDPR